jgi:hypothetical protein
MAFLRHVGKHGDRKVAVVFREVPGEPHMCLVVYTELLNRTVHDPMIKSIESDIGQNSKNLADALNRSYTTDGQIILQKLHAEGQLKKVQTEQIVMTPTPGTLIKLSELNTILDEMEKGEQAVQKLAEMDNQLGMQDPAAVARRMRGDTLPEEITQNAIPPVTPLNAPDAALGDNAIANNLRQQAMRMSAEAKGLLAEADRLLQEANQLDPSSTSTPTVESVTTTKKTRGRPKRVTVTA